MPLFAMAHPQQGLLQTLRQKSAKFHLQRSSCNVYVPITYVISVGLKRQGIIYESSPSNILRAH